jgi:ferrous iron transport protein A
MLTLEAHQAVATEAAETAPARGVARAVRAAVERQEASVCLLDLPRDSSAVIVRLEAPGPARNPVAARLAELGFLAGERVRIVARAALGGPLAVRVGTGTFALRREEAACVRVWPGATLK